MLLEFTGVNMAIIKRWKNYVKYMEGIEFLLDENVLGLDRFLEYRVKYHKVGDPGFPTKEATDSEIVLFAKENNLVIITKDIKMAEQCQFENVRCVTFNDIDFARKIIRYSNSD